MAADQSDRLDAVDTRHGNVGDDYVRREPLRRVHQGATILDRRNDVEVRSEQLAEPFRSFRVILGEQYPWAPQGGFRT